MSRSAEFSAGATFKQKDAGGNETTRNAVDAMQRPAPTTRRAGPLGPNTEAEERMWQQEIAWSRSH